MRIREVVCELCVQLDAMQVKRQEKKTKKKAQKDAKNKKEDKDYKKDKKGENNEKKRTLLRPRRPLVAAKKMPRYR